MRYLFILLLGVVLYSCGTKVPYTNAIRDEYNLETDKDLRKVQFYTSATIIFEKSKQTGSQGTTDGGSLVSSSSKEQERVIIPINTKCVFEGFGPNGEYILRFEPGLAKTITFSTRPNQANGKYYLVAEWEQNVGGKLTYGNEKYTTSSSSGNAYLMVVLKKLQKVKRKDRVVKGMKV